MNIGNSIRIAMVKCGMRQQDVAKKVGVTRTYISGLCNGRKPSQDLIVKLADCFNMPVSEFIKLGE